MTDYIHNILLTGASGTGKSSLIRGAIEHYGSGALALALGEDELDSYLGLGNVSIGTFDDPMFFPQYKEFNATGLKDLIEWLKNLYVDLKADVDAGKPPRYSVLGMDTISAVGRLAYNATLSNFKMTEAPPAIGSSGAPFYTYMRVNIESAIRIMRAIKGLGVHWIVASHPTEAETTAIQETKQYSGSSKIMPDLPGGIKNVIPAYFSTVLDINISNKGVHYARWQGDEKRVTKSRLGKLSATGVIDLPEKPLDAWKAIDSAVNKALVAMVGSK